MTGLSKRHIRKIYPNGNRLVQMFFVLTLAVLLSGCAGIGRQTPGPGFHEEHPKVTITVWSPQEDQSNDNGRWLQTQCDSFAAAHEEWRITFKYGVCPEGDVAKILTTDPSTGADVYMISNDQISDLVHANAIAELGGIWVDRIKSCNAETTWKTVVYDGSVYGFPFTANTWFMYYDKSVFTEEDVKSLDTMLRKGIVAFPLENPWYIEAFYIANGCTLFGAEGDDAEAGIDFGGEKAEAVTHTLVDLVANPNFVSGDVGTHSYVKAFFSGAWDHQKALDVYGTNLGIAALPTVTIDGQVRQMKAFAGTKAMGVNPSTKLYQTHPEIAVALASWLADAPAQQAHYDLRNVIPANIDIDVSSDPLAMAQMETMRSTSIVQPMMQGMSNYWTPAESMGKELAVGTVTHENAAVKTAAMNEEMNRSIID